ncbi:hypothetical protein EJ06DRAFT_531567 [Trichodelitschia bisporula]|uniref:Protein kinase domain-containing protein n=1 Tax=Trichodelitschia bisporula TaxID=703511 RepID=A0A6G1HTI7_9PEZI|nr:hypothetical protein EJ06DRAFT_531567 [Trichodelitschia bisporula]
MSTATQDDYQSQRKRDRDRSTRGDEDVAVRNDFDPRDGKSESNRNPVRETSSDLEGTMYGPYDSDPGWKTPSVGSGASHPADLEDSGPYIPDHFMHVPLLTLDTARRVFRDTVLGLEYLHYQGIIHRDIKPANLLQTKDEHIKISDFGVSYLGKARSEEGAGDQSESDAHDTDEALELAKTVGTPAFYAPELCQTDCEDLEPPPITNQIDVWALGVTLYCLIFGRVPFHERNSFVLMRLIAETDVYIPRLRLKAVNPQAGSYPSRNKDYRAAGTVDHEEVDDELYDLLKRLLIKDPRQRIKLIEVKRHPWVLRGLPNPIRWLEETDPGRMTQGKKIEVSKQDIDVAVVQLGVLDRVRSIAQKFKGAFSISNRAESRRRSKSSATASGDLPTSTASSSSTISQDARRQEGRRPSLRPDDVIFALRASREPEHPLSQSVTTSPEMRDRSDFLIGPDSRPDSPSLLAENQTARLSHSTQRPQPPDRAQSAVSTAGSIRTIRPADIANNSSGATTLPAMPSTPLEMPSTSSLGGILGGAKKMMRSVRSRDRGFSTYGRASPVDQLIAAGDDPHAEPSIAFSNTLAAGQVHPPASLREGSTTGSSAAPSPISSRPPSLTSPESLRPVYAITDDGGLSRQSSISSVSSRRRFRPNPDRTSVVPAYLPLLDDVGEERRFYRVVPTRDSSEDKVQRAKEQQIRRRMLEDDIAERPTSSSSRKRPSSFLMQEGVFPPCPLSPDDEAYYDQLEKSQRRTANPGAGTHTQNAKSKSTIVSSSSEDYFASHMSQSTSNPSIPSVVSAASSLPPDDRAHMNNADWMTEALPSDASSATARYAEEDDGYAGDDALETDEDDDSDDSFIEMSRRKSVKRSNSISCAEVLVHRRQTGAAESIRSVRSGSSNTMQRMKSNGGETDDEIVRGRVGRQTAEE